MTEQSNDMTWHTKAANLSFCGKALIEGERVDAHSGAEFDCISPIDGRILTSIARCDSQDIESAVNSARAAFDDGRWSHASPAHRKSVMVAFARLVEQHAEELALLETLDMGKPISDAMTVDLPAVWQTLAWFGEAIDKIYDEVAPTGRSSLALVTREPIGVIGCVVPWNFPLLMATWKIAPALAAGNSVILKPAEQSPLSALRLGELALEAGLPPGVLNVLPGYGVDAGAALGLHSEVDAIAFTGSTEVGKKFLTYSGQSNMKHIWLECGGKSPNIVMDDCADLDSAATAAAYAVFFNQGEVCSAGSRLLVQESVYDEFLEKVANVAKLLIVGNPLDTKTAIGAMVDNEQMESVLSYIDIGRDEGASFILEGGRTRQDSGGFYLAPTILANVKSTARVVQEEIFGPVLCALPFKDAHDAVKIANDSIYGLAAGLWTSNLNNAHTISRDLRAGTVWVNNFDESDITVPFGGYRQSGNGRDKSLHAFDKYTQLKTTWIALR